MEQLENEVMTAMEQYQMIRAGDSILVGLSGGADSVCLLTVLYHLGNEGKLPILGKLSAVHVHHGLRDSADGDEDFVRDLCGRLGVPVQVYHVDAAAEARNRGMSLEEAGRTLRREIFAKEARRLGEGTIVALAHHREDSAETLLFNLCRGTSSAGLAGIRPISFLETEPAGVQHESPEQRSERRIRVIRPLIGISRSAIEDWLRMRGQSWREDETNSDIQYTRNVLRLQIFPELERKVNPAAGEHMARTARELAEVQDGLDEITERIFRQCCVEDRREKLTLRTGTPFNGYSRFWQKRVLYLALTRVCGGKKDITSSHVLALESLLLTGGSSSMDLPGGVVAQKEYQLLMLYGTGRGGAPQDRETARCPECTKEADGRTLSGAEEEQPREEMVLPVSGEAYSFRVLTYDGVPVPAGRYTKWLDYDKISAPIQMRTRREGDRMAIGRNADGTFRHKKLTRIMIDRRIPARIREKMVLPAAGEEILWFPGYRISERYMVGPDTRHILEIRIQSTGGQILPEEN